MSAPLISVVIPVYNDSEELLVTLDSIAGQTHRNLEIIVVDDGSDPPLGTVAATVSDGRVTCVGQSHANANVARNRGIERSRGEYVAMLDAGDEWYGNHLEDCLATLQASGADGLYGSLIVREAAGGNVRPVIARELRPEETMIDYLLDTGYGAQTSTLFMTAESAKNILWDPGLNRHQDYDFVARYAQRYRFAAKPNPTAIHNYYGKSGRQPDWLSCIRVIERHAAEINPCVYRRYHRGMLALAVRLNAPAYIVEHYERQADTGDTTP